MNSGSIKVLKRYLMCSYLYYVANKDTPYDDPTFDHICRKLLANWNDFEHMHKHLCDEEMLVAGTGFSIKDSDYSNMLKCSAHEWADSYKDLMCYEMNKEK